MVSQPPRAERFLYDGFEIDHGLSRLTCRYALDDRRFTEVVTVASEGDWTDPAAVAAARLVFLLAGVSYFKAGAPRVVDLGTLAVTSAERAFLRTFYLEGLGEFAYRNQLDLSGLEFVGGRDEARVTPRRVLSEGRPLVPFGGGIDSIVTADSVGRRFPAASLFVVERTAHPYTAIDRPAALIGLPVVTAHREVDPQVLRSAELGFFNGHVPVTGIISAIAVLAGVLGGHDSVVMSNEWSASVGTVAAGRPVNHQYSKSEAFEREFRRVLDAAIAGGPRYFSLLRPYSELWVARRFAELPRYHRAFRSCNRSFHLDPAQRLDAWCGTCDKCCFIDLILAPFLPASELSAIFGGSEPLADPALKDRFRSLIGTPDTSKPFECVGDVGECRAAVLLAADRDDRSTTVLLADLAAEVRGSGGAPPPGELLGLLGDHWIPDEYTPADQLV